MQRFLLVCLGLHFVASTGIAQQQAAESRYYVYYALANGGSVGGKIFDSEGTPLSGPRYNAELWGNGTDPSSLTPAFEYNAYNRNGRLVQVFAPFGTGSKAGYFRDPTYTGLGVFNPDVGDECWLQVRAWDTTLGETYEEVAAKNIGGYGESPIFKTRGALPDAPNPVPPAPLFGLQSFQLRPIVPEPGTAALLVLGLAGLGWVWRRREQG